MRIKLSSVFVDDQAKALRFYTEVLGFATKTDAPVGTFRWLTVVSPEEPDGTQLLLEPTDNPAAKTFQAAIYAQGIPATSFVVDDVHREHARLVGLGVAFRTEPTKSEWGTDAMFDDTCGNLINLHQE
jgi:predicted enzyme related to lactoylglutathione lyase